jgi:sensor domain CHASE-containing protein
VRLRQRMLLIFAVTLAIGTAIVYVVSREMVLASFRQLEDEQMKRDVGFATAVLDLDFRNLAESIDDYAYWDRMCEFLVSRAKRIFGPNLKTKRWSSWDLIW